MYQKNIATTASVNDFPSFECREGCGGVVPVEVTNIS